MSGEWWWSTEEEGLGVWCELLNGGLCVQSYCFGNG